MVMSGLEEETIVFVCVCVRARIWSSLESLNCYSLRLLIAEYVIRSLSFFPPPSFFLSTHVLVYLIEDSLAKDAEVLSSKLSDTLGVLLSTFFGTASYFAPIIVYLNLLSAP